MRLPGGFGQSYILPFQSQGHGLAGFQFADKLLSFRL
jgi:hypothetical protein